MNTEHFNRQGEAISLEEWVRLFEKHDYRIVKRSQLRNGTLVSTIWMGLDHGFGHGRRLLFETLVFPRRRLGRPPGEEWDGERYGTEQEARSGHYRLCRWWESNGQWPVRFGREG